MFSIAGCVPFSGLVSDNEQVIALDALRPACRSLDLPLGKAATLMDLMEDWDRNVASIRAALTERPAISGSAPLSTFQRHAPLPSPGQVICAGANYRKHVIELLVAQQVGDGSEAKSADERLAAATALMDERAKSGVPYAFVKPSTAVAGPDDALVLPDWSAQLDWELELALVIGRPTFHVTRDNALDHVAGYMIANDVTARDLVYRHDDMKVLGTDFMRAKGAPGFLPTGPYFVPRQDLGDSANLQLTLTLNGTIMQDDVTADMIFDVARLIEHVSAYTKLMPGDLICTGSPAGNGAHHKRYLQGGDVMEGSITGLGSQKVQCVAAIG